MTEILELSKDAPEPPVRCDRGVTLAKAGERTLHAPDVHLLAVERGSLLARCSCWSNAAGDVGIIGHYAAASRDASKMLLERACSVLASAGCRTALGPMDGNTWRSYRFVVERGTEQPFFLEPANPDEWPEQWSAAGFEPCATYSSALNDDLSVEDARTEGPLRQIAAAGISLRPVEAGAADSDMDRVFALSTNAFRGNPFYAAIPQDEFRRQSAALLPFIRPELTLLAERGEDLVGFLFAVPDVLRGPGTRPPDTVILKTLAVDPSASGMGLGGVLMDLVQRTARRSGFRRAIHALMHDANPSRRISARYARTMRRYALFSRPLEAVGQ